MNDIKPLLNVHSVEYATLTHCPSTCTEYGCVNVPAFPSELVLQGARILCVQHVQVQPKLTHTVERASPQCRLMFIHGENSFTHGTTACVELKGM